MPLNSLSQSVPQVLPVKLKIMPPFEKALSEGSLEKIHRLDRYHSVGKLINLQCSLMSLAQSPSSSMSLKNLCY